MIATVTKLHSIKSSPEVQVGDITTGYIDFPVVGKRFEAAMPASMGGGWLSTSPVKSIYIKGTGQDKLVLPESFKDVDLSNLKMEDGEMLLATQNSVYLVSGLT